MNYFPLTTNTLSSKDKKLAIKVINSGNITRGEYNKLVERKFNKIFKRYTLLVNSGSSANLLALALLTNQLSKNKLIPGDEVLIPSLCWSTSLYPIIQMGLKPIFVDVSLATLNIDLNKIEKSITKKTKALMLIHALGNCANMKLLKKLLNRKKILLIEDCCEALGSKFNNQLLGTFGRVSTFSFYFSHHITSGEGGLVTCKSKQDYLILLSLRSHGWSREIDAYNKNKNESFNRLFNFINLGYNLRLTDIQAALLYNQIGKINEYYKNRNYNYKKIYNKIMEDKILRLNIHLIKDISTNQISWFNFPIILKSLKNYQRDQICYKLNQLGIETRPIISGDFSKQKVIKRFYNSIPNKDSLNVLKINQSGFMIGISSRKLTVKKINKLILDLKRALKQFL